MATTDWFTKNVGAATRWRSNSGDPFEGGVDVPMPGGTPIYALASGPLKGYGYFYHGGPYFTSQEYGAGSNPGYGVVSEQVNVPGLGLEDLYYQHIDLANNFQFCASGNCGNQMVKAGQLLGYSRGNVGEVEVGLGANTGWGGIWGNSSDPGQWIGDPRSAISAVAGAGPSITPGSVPTTSQTAGPSGGGCPWYCLFGLLNVAGGANGNPLCTNCPGGNPQQASQLSQTGQQVGAAITNLTSPDFWTRVALVIFGGLIVVVAVSKMIK